MNKKTYGRLLHALRSERRTRREYWKIGTCPIFYCSRVCKVIAQRTGGKVEELLRVNLALYTSASKVWIAEVNQIEKEAR